MKYMLFYVFSVNLEDWEMVYCQPNDSAQFTNRLTVCKILLGETGVIKVETIMKLRK